jgi:hypothetical protein
MESTISCQTTFTLVLNEEEAQWLRAYMQNPHCPLEEESDQDSKMRKKFFEAVTPKTARTVPSPPGTVFPPNPYVIGEMP